MKKITFLFAFFVFLGMQVVFAQTTITGTVSSDDGTIPSATVVVKGNASVGTVTDMDGKFTLQVPANTTTLVVSFVGMKTQEVDVAGKSSVNVMLETESMAMEEIVVTALGVSREKKALGYAVQDVKGDELVKAREMNVVNSLSGKVAGINITSSSGAVGASSRVELRGSSSITGNSQPLYVVDGIPLDNSNYSGADSRGGFDTPNGIADINSDDIASVSILKGPSAAALYGVRAANGVIVITTKSGKSGKSAVGVSFNNTTSYEAPLLLPSFQNSYGQGPNADFFEWGNGTTGDGGVDESWGPPLDRGLMFTQWDSYKVDGATQPWVSHPNNVRDMYQTGVTQNSNISFSGGTDNMGYRLSLGYTDQKGMIPNTDMKKYNFSGNANYSFTPKFKANFNVGYTKMQSDNLPIGGYTDENPLQQTIWSGRNVDFNALKDWQNLPSAPAGTPAAGTPINWNTQFQNNPFWVLDNNLNGLDKDRVLGAFSLSYQLTEGLSIVMKSSIDQYSQLTTQQKAIGTNSFPNGYYAEAARRYLESNTEAVLSYSKDLTADFSINLNLGGNTMYRRYTRVSAVSPQLELPNLYNLSNVKSGVSVQLTNEFKESKINSVYAFGSVAYKNAIFAEFTARNDVSSILPTDGNSFFYPSVNLSAVLTDLFNIKSNVFSFGKVRAGWSKVGGTGILDAYQLQQTYSYETTPWGSTALLMDPRTLNNPKIKPEMKTSIEFGSDLRFFSNRVKLDMTYYNMVSTDLIVDVEVSSASGYEFAKKNVGEMTNKGIEIIFGITPIKTKDLTVDFDFNYSKNVNEVTSLGGLKALILGGQWNVDVQAREGQPFGVIWGPGYQKDPDGNIIHKNGLPLVATDYVNLGNYQPKWRGGITMKVTYKDLSFSTTVDAKMGGDVYSMTTTWGRYSGVLEETLLGRETGLVGDGVMKIGTADAPNYVKNDVVVPAKLYNQTAYANSVAEGSVFDASYVKWRELVIGYNIPTKWVSKTPIKGASLSIVARNLMILFKNAPHIDPETAFSSSNDALGMEFGQFPSARSIGFNINLSF